MLKENSFIVIFDDISNDTNLLMTLYKHLRKTENKKRSRISI